MSVEDTKLIIFGWIVTILPDMTQKIIEDDEYRKKVNELVDKLYEVFYK